MNLSETAFLVPLLASSSAPWSSCKKFGLRWFTPTNEVKLCGHATLASAHALFFEAGIDFIIYMDWYLKYINTSTLTLLTFQYHNLLT